MRVPKNSIVALRCQPPKGAPSPAVSWEKDGAPVDTLRDRRVQVTSQANLSLVLIRKVQTSDAGQYLCVASNLVGTRKSDPIKLNVYGKFVDLLLIVNVITKNISCDNSKTVLSP